MSSNQSSGYHAIGPDPSVDNGYNQGEPRGDQANTPTQLSAVEIGVALAADSIGASLVDLLETLYEDHKHNPLYLDALRAANTVASAANDLKEAWNR